MKLVIAGGGTGGHLFPGMAVAEVFLEKEAGNEVLFIGTERGIESKMLAGGKFPLRTIQALPLKGRSLWGKAKALWMLPRAICEAWHILKEFRPQIMVGVGGYASGPALVAGFLLGIKRAIHEQNLVPGMTNRLLKWITQRIFISFEETKEYFPAHRTLFTGMPVRKEILLCRPGGASPGRDGRRPGGRFTLFVFGGSAGAHRINQAMMEALEPLQEIRGMLKIFHQTGSEDFEAVSTAYRKAGFDSLARPFFEEMAPCYGSSDLVICRAGASTIAELALCGKAAIFVPYPHAAHQHQLINARALVKRGAGRLIRDEALNGTSLSREVLDLYHHPEDQRRMEQAIRPLGIADAAQQIVNHCYGLVNRACQV